jgi:hypothetical protein
MRAIFSIMRSSYRTFNDCEMQHNAEVGLFTRPSNINKKRYGSQVDIKVSAKSPQTTNNGGLGHGSRNKI